jgi:hypothetical protein
MKIVEYDKKQKFLRVLVGYDHFGKPLYCPVCSVNGESSRLFDVHQGHGELEWKCRKCKTFILVVFSSQEYTYPTDLTPLKPKRGRPKLTDKTE